MPDPAKLRGRLVSRLVEDRRLPDPRWRAAFADVPREVFVPAFYRAAGEHEWRLVDHQHPDWLAEVYRDEALVTQLDGDEGRGADGSAVSGSPTSSSSAPGLMALMLSALCVADADAVLEVGTGTGYNAALICHRLGADALTSIDVDPRLVERARERLAGLGYAPHLVLGDGRAGHPPRAPYDRVMTTVALPAVPVPLLAQTRPGGQVLVCLDRGGGGLMPLLSADGSGGGQGRFLPDYGGFMSLRDRAVGTAELYQQAVEAADAGAGERRDSELPLAAVADPTEPSEFAAALWVPGLRRLRTGRTTVWLLHADGSWVRRDGGVERGGVVEQGGPRRLWDELEDTVARWERLGRPGRGGFGLTVSPDGAHRLWLTDPATGPSWPLPGVPPAG